MTITPVVQLVLVDLAFHPQQFLVAALGDLEPGLTNGHL
jgi:hypothetical protein